MESAVVKNGHTPSILGCPCVPISSEDEAHNILTAFVNGGRGGYSVAVNSEKIITYSKLPELKVIIDNSALAYPDGAGAVIGLRWLHGVRSVKINFPIVALNAAEAHSWRVFVLGATEEVNTSACIVIRKRFPNIRIVGRIHGYVSDDEKMAHIKAADPQLVLAALGSPRQEIFARLIVREFSSLFVVGCGGALDILAGRVSRAPDFMVQNNLEWLYRLWKEPHRWRRQLVLPVFMFKLFGAWSRNKLTG